jgi:signal recognition particle receptor subunit beta
MLWRHYFESTEAIVWVVDSSDTQRLHEAREELLRVLSEEQLRGAPLLVFANKQDMPNALPVDQLVQKLDLASQGPPHPAP